MIKPNTLLFTAFSLSCVTLMLSSCDGDDDTIGTSGGSAGKAAGTGGAGKAGASSGRGGGGGTTGGKGGTAGDAGGGAVAGDTGGAGVGAQSGAGGTLSSGGTANAGGQAPGGAGNGAEAGSSGNAGAGAGGAANDELLTCKTGCTTSDDCASVDDVYHCDDTLHLCVECSTHADCTPKANGWQTDCTDDAGCAGDPFLSACIDIGGTGRCAAPPDSTFGCLFGVAQPYPRFGIDPVELVDVCVVDSGRCSSEHRCMTGCTDAPDFCTSVTFGHGDTCDETSGLCHCATDDECSTGHCSSATHLCDECETGDDCSSATTGQECHGGHCGCSGISACPASSFPDGTPLCE